MQGAGANPRSSSRAFLPSRVLQQQQRSGSVQLLLLALACLAPATCAAARLTVTAASTLSQLTWNFYGAAALPNCDHDTFVSTSEAELTALCSGDQQWSSNTLAFCPPSCSQADQLLGYGCALDYSRVAARYYALWASMASAGNLSSSGPIADYLRAQYQAALPGAPVDPFAWDQATQAGALLNSSLAVASYAQVCALDAKAAAAAQQLETVAITTASTTPPAAAGGDPAPPADVGAGTMPQLTDLGSFGPTEAALAPAGDALAPAQEPSAAQSAPSSGAVQRWVALQLHMAATGTAAVLMLCI